MHPSPLPISRARTRWRYADPRLALLLFVILLVGIPEEAKAQTDTCNSYPSPHQRMGVNVAKEGNVTINDYAAARLSAGWYHDYNRQSAPSHPDGMQYHQMIRSGTNLATLAQTVGPIVDANPGAIWAVGNEPDRYGQDEQTPAQYAVFYHQVYTFLKGRDPTSRVATAAIVQATPIRLRYLSMVLAEYQQRYGRPMPVDIWTVHGFILPENCGWGAGLPPGLEAYVSEAVPCPATLSEHGNIETFKSRIRAFRQWMKANGYRDKPLIVTEYGILLSKYHGFPSSTVRSYMLASFDFLLNTTDSQTGLPSDGNRLVQEFSWFSLNFYEFNLTTGQGLNGNLFDHDSRQITPLGEAFESYAKGIRVNVTDLKVIETSAGPASVNNPVTLRSRYGNQGGIAATDVRVRFWLGDPRNGGQLLGTSPLTSQVLAGCHPLYQSEVNWTPPAAGTYTIFTDFQAANLATDRDLTNNYGSFTFTVGTTPVATPTATATSVPGASVTPTKTATPAATATPTKVASGTSTMTPTATHTASALTSTSTATRTATPTQASTGAPTVTPTASSTPTGTSFSTGTPTATITPEVSATVTPTLSTAVTPPPTATQIATATVTPVTETPTPDPLTVRAVIQPAAGGTLTIDSAGHRVTLTIPVDAIEETTTFVLREERGPLGSTGDLRFLGYAFTINAYQHDRLINDFVFIYPAIVTVTYRDDDLGGAQEEELTLYYYAPHRTAWQADGIAVKSRNPALNQLTVAIAHLTQFGLFAGPQATPTPLPTGTPDPSKTPEIPTVPTLPPITQELYLPLVTNE